MENNHLGEMSWWIFFFFIITVFTCLVEMYIKCFSIFTSFDSSNILVARGAVEVLVYRYTG